MKGSQSVVLLDETRGNQLWAAVREDDVARYIDQYGADTLSSAVK